MSEDLHENGELTARYAGPKREGMGLTKAALVMLGVGAIVAWLVATMGATMIAGDVPAAFVRLWPGMTTMS